METPDKPGLCDCERGHNGLGMAGRECDCGPERIPGRVRVPARAGSSRVAALGEPEGYDFGWTHSAEVAARDRSKALAETLAQMLNLDDVLACRTMPFGERLAAARKLERLRACAAALIEEIALAA